jgi:hypothetical protein
MITNTVKASEYSLNDFMQFLDDNGEDYKVSSKGVITLYGAEITFRGKPDKELRFDGYIEDYFGTTFKDEIRQKTRRRTATQNSKRNCLRIPKNSR